jgi:recombination protein RecA
MSEENNLKNLKSVLKQISKKYGESVVKIGVDDLAVDGILSLGTPSFDFCLYGGIPEGRIVEFSGAEGSGKTTTAFIVAASYQREEIKRNPDNPRAIILLDNEGTADPVWAKKLGYNMDADAEVPTIIIRPEAQSAEEIFDMAIDMLKTGEVGLLIFDSIATLVPQQIVDESMEKQQMGGIAKALTRFANTALGLLRKYKATLIAINQVRENISGYGDPLITPGGRSWKHACSTRIMFKRGDFFDEEGNVLAKKDAQSPAGHVIEAAVLKTKTCKWDRKLGYMHLNYTKGIDVLQDTLDVATHFGYIDNSVQGTFKLIDIDTGEIMCDEAGNEIKIRGKKNLVAYFRDNITQWKRLYDLVYNKLKQKDDPFIVSFEKMLDRNIDEEFAAEIKESAE